MTPAGLDADLAVVGAGPAGAATALIAARAGRRVIVLDQSRFPRDKPCGEGLLPSGRGILRELGLEQAAMDIGAPQILGIRLGRPGESFQEVPFPGPATGSVEAGLGLRRLRFDAMLAERLASEPLVSFQPQTTVRRVVSATQHVPRLITARGEILAANLVIADGLRSRLRRQLGWTIGPVPPHRYGVVGHWLIDGPPEPWIRIALGDGMEFYQAPISSGEVLLAVLCRRRAMGSFAGQVVKRYRELALEMIPELRRGQQADTPVACGPFHYLARQVAGDRVFLVGDASGFSDPIIGEGLAAALLQARAVVQAMSSPHPESSYSQSHRRLTRNRHRVAGLILYLTDRPARLRRGLRGIRIRPDAMQALLGVNLGYWGFDRINPRQWAALLGGL